MSEYDILLEDAPASAPTSKYDVLLSEPEPAATSEYDVLLSDDQSPSPAGAIVGATAAPKTAPDTSFGSALVQGVDQPLEAIGTTAEVLGLPSVAKVLRGATEAPVGYESAAERFAKPKEGDFTVAGFAPAQIPRAVVEQFGQVGGSIISRVVGGLLGGAIGSATGAGGGTAVAPGPGTVLGGAAGIPTGAVIGQFAGPFLFGALQVAGPIAKERAKNNGRAEPNGRDIAVGLITAAASGSLDAIGAKYLPGGNKASGGIVRQIAKAFAVEGGTEGVQSVAEQTGESVGTRAGLQVSPRKAIGEALIGGIAGGTISAAASPVTARQQIDEALIESESSAPPVPIDPQTAQPLTETGSSGDAAPGDVTGTQAPVVAKGVETLSFKDGFTAIVDPKTEEVFYQNSKGERVGRLETAELPGGMIGVELHTLDDDARGQGMGQSAIAKLAELTGKPIVSDQYPSDSADSMWRRLGAKKEQVQVGEDETQWRYVYRSAPVVAEPKKSDYDLYQEQQAKLNELLNTGDAFDSTGELSPAAEKLWKDGEVIKLRNNGMPPTPPEPISEPSVEPGRVSPQAVTTETPAGTTGPATVPSKSEPASGPSVAGLTEDFVNAERAKRGEQPVSKEKPVTNEETIEHGRAVIQESPARPREVMERLRSASPTERTISREDAAVLLAEKRRLTTARNTAGDRALDESLTPEERAVAKQDWTDLEAQVEQMDQAAQDARSTWGGFGQFWQRQLREDFSFENLQRRARIAKEGPLTDVEVAALEEKAKTIERIQTKVEETQSAVDKASEDTSVAAAIEKDTKDIAKQKRGPRKKDAFESALDKAIKALSDKGELFADPLLIQSVGKPLLRGALQVVRAAYKGGKALAEAVADGIEHLRKGSKNLDETKAKEFFDSIFAGAKPEKTVAGVNARAKANALVGEELSPAVVTDLVRAHIDAGVHGEKAVMKAVHADLVKIHPDLTERDVRRIYSDYGKVRFPSKEATAKEMRELTQLVKMQEDIDRMTRDNLDPLRKGYQRDKATQAIRDKIKARNELLKKREGPPSPEKLATRDQAKQTALRNAIEDLDRELATGVKRERSKPGQDSPETERLRAERDAMREKLKEIQDAEKPVKSEEERYNETTAKRLKTQLAAVKKRIAEGDFAPRTKKIQPALTKANLDAKALLEKARNEVRQGEEKYRLANRTATQKAKDRAALLLQSARGIILGSDIGVLTRQGLFAWSRPLKAIKATAEAFKAAVSPSSMARWEIEVRDRVIDGKAAAPLRKEAGLSTTDTINHPEELVITRLLSRIPDFNVGGKTVKLSSIGQTLERFQTTFINSVRTDFFDAGIKAGMTPEELKVRANFINSATGRSNAKNIPKWMSVMFTSPRYERSRWEMLAQPIRNVGVLARSGVNGELNKAALANLQDMAVTVALIYGTFKMAELEKYKVNWDPTSADFLKMRKGDEVWDVSAGLAPRIRDVMRMYVAMTHPSYKDNIGKALVGPLLRAFNPAIKTPIEQGGVAAQRARGVKDPKLPFTGFKSEEEKEGWITMAPLIVQSVNQTLKEEGAGPAIFAGAREFIGSSVTRYPEPKPSR